MIRIALVALFLLSFPSWASTPLATVNGQAITQSDVDLSLSQFNEGQRKTMLKDDTFKKRVLDGLVQQEVLHQKAVQDKLDQTAAFKEAEKAFRRQFLATMLLDKELGPKITEDAARNFYKKNRQLYTTDQVRALHILVPTEQQAVELLKKAQKDGVDFAELAVQFSKDTSVKNNRGDLGYFGKEQFEPTFTKLAFSTAPGKVAGPVQTAFGWHVIKVLDKKFGTTLNYDEVELSVKNALRQEMVEQYVYKLTMKTQVSYK